MAMLIWILLLSLTASLVQPSYLPPENIDFIDDFRGAVSKHAERTEFVPADIQVRSGHDAFRGKAHTSPAISNFKASDGSVRIDDGFRGAPRDRHVDEETRTGRIVSDAIPNLISDPRASRYVKPYVASKKHEKKYEYVQQSPVLDVPLASYEKPLDKNANKQENSYKPASPTYLSAAPFVKSLNVPSSLSVAIKNNADKFHDLSYAPIQKPVTDNHYEFVAIATAEPAGEEVPIQKSAGSAQYEFAAIAEPAAEEAPIQKSAASAQYEFVARNSVAPNEGNKPLAKDQEYEEEYNFEKSNHASHMSYHSEVTQADIDDYEFVKQLPNTNSYEYLPLPVTVHVSMAAKQANDVTAGQKQQGDKYEYVKHFSATAPTPKEIDQTVSYEFVDIPAVPSSVVRPALANYAAQKPTKNGQKAREYEYVAQKPQKNGQKAREYEYVAQKPQKNGQKAPEYEYVAPALDYQYVAPVGRVHNVDSSVSSPAPIKTAPYEYIAPTKNVSQSSNGATSNSSQAKPVTSEQYEFVEKQHVTTSMSPLASNVNQGNNPKAEACNGENDGEMLAAKTCRRHYVQCVEGQAVNRFCLDPLQIFSKRVNGCVLKSEAPECNTDAFVGETIDGQMFCNSRNDGFYRHPENCSRILQCFEHEVYEYPSCDSSLAFEERSGVCTYRDQVEGCSDNKAKLGGIATKDDPASSSGCNGHAHGDHIRNKDNCSAYFRCVWDRLVPMDCPAGTVFNPSLNVCDYRDNVPECSGAQKK